MNGFLVVITLTILRLVIPVSLLFLTSAWLRQRHPIWF